MTLSLAVIAGGRHTGRRVNARLRSQNRELAAENQELTQRADACAVYVHKARVQACQDSMVIARLRAERAEAIQVAQGLQAQLDDKDREHAETVARIDEQHGDTVRDLEARLADMERRLDVGVLAEAAAATTQETDVRSLRERFESGPVVRYGVPPWTAITNPGCAPSQADTIPLPVVQPELEPTT